MKKILFTVLFALIFIPMISYAEGEQDGWPVTEGANALEIDVTTLTMTGDSNLNDLDNINATTETTLENALDLQDLQGAVTDSQVPNDITITEVDGSVTNEIQDLSLSVNTLSLSGDATTVDLSGYLDNTDAQDLSLTVNTLSLTGDATSVDLSGYLDNTDAQDLSLSVNTLSLTGDATSVDLSGYLDNTDAQDLSLTGDTLSLTGDATSVSLSGYYNSLADLQGAVTNDFHNLGGTDDFLTEEEVEDYVGGMLGGTETGISVTYQDDTGDIDFEHSSANGYVHIPASGASAQILQYSSAGTAKWITVSGEATIADNGAITLANDALDDQYYDSEADLTGLLDNNYQALNNNLTSISLLGTAADKGLYTTALNTWAEFSLTAAGRAILDDANAAAQATTLGLGIGDSPTFANVSLGTGELTTGSINRASGTLTLEIGGTAEASISTAGIKVTDHIALNNNAVNASAGLLDIYSPTNAAYYNLYLSNYPVTTVDGTYNTGSLYVENYTNVATTKTNSGSATGLSMAAMRNRRAATDDDGTLVTMSAERIYYGHDDTDADENPITTLINGLYMHPYYKRGTIGTLYDIFLSSGSPGITPSVRYSVYQESINALNFFAGTTTINDNDGVDNEDKLIIGDADDIDDIYVYGDVSALTFTDRASPIPEGRDKTVLDDIKKIKIVGTEDKKTLPDYIQSNQEVPVYEETPLVEVPQQEALERIEVTNQFDEKGLVILNKIVKEGIYKDEQDPLDQDDDKYYQKVNTGEVIKDGNGVIKQRIKTGTKIEMGRLVGTSLSMHDVAIQKLIDKIEALQAEIEALKVR